MSSPSLEISRPRTASSADAAPPSSPRRILFLDHTASMGGGEIALLNLTRFMHRDRYTPVVVLCSDGPLAGKLRDAGIETHVLPLNSDVLNTRKDSLGGGTLLQIKNVFHTFLYTLRLARTMRKLKIALVHTNSLKADIIGGVAARLARIPILWHIRDRIAGDYLPAPVAAVFRRLCRIIPDFVIANSSATLQTLALRPRHHTATVPSGIELGERMGVVHDGMRSPDEDPSPERTWRGAPRIGLVGRITPWKGQHIFLRAAAHVLQRIPDATFQIIGAALFSEQHYDREIRQLALTLGIQDRVEFTGFREDIPQLVANLDVLVHASTSGEPFGQVVIEGMAAGKPVVATNGGGIPEIVVDGVTGLLVPMGDADSMAAAICRLLEDRAVAERMGLLGRQRVVENFTIENTVSKVEDLYDDMLDGPRSQSGTRRGPTSVLGRLLDLLKRRSLIHFPTNRDALVCHLVAVACVGLTLLLCLYLRTHLPSHSPTFVSFLGAIAIAAWIGGFWSGALALVLSCLAVAYFILPPDQAFAIGPEDRPRFYLFIMVSALVTVLIEMMHSANRRIIEARTEAEALNRRMAFLAKAATTVSVSLDYESTLRNLAFLANSEISDWCVIDIVGDDGALRRAVTSHRNPEKSELLKRLAEFPPDLASNRHRVAKALRTGCAELVPLYSHESLNADVQDPHHREIVSALGHNSLMIVPLVAGAQTLGAITFVSADPNRCYNRDDLALATELTLRAALALDNARSYSTLRHLANLRNTLNPQNSTISLKSAEIAPPPTLP
jgi:glycosyltransferase involved in cell wall biosynthesis